jgi:hypothetical protein
LPVGPDFKVKIKVKFFWMAEPSAGADPTVPSNNLQVRRTAGPSGEKIQNIEISRLGCSFMRFIPLILR